MFWAPWTDLFTSKGLSFTFCEEVAFEKVKSAENEKQTFLFRHILSTNWFIALGHDWKLDNLGKENQRKCFFFSSDLSSFRHSYWSINCAQCMLNQMRDNGFKMWQNPQISVTEKAYEIGNKIQHLLNNNNSPTKCMQYGRVLWHYEWLFTYPVNVNNT